MTRFVPVRAEAVTLVVADGGDGITSDHGDRAGGRGGGGGRPPWRPGPGGGRAHPARPARE
ncbi:hypothetical protein ACFV23_04365, partial [Streptomyces sp. NPDC059627]